MSRATKGTEMGQGKLLGRSWMAFTEATPEPAAVARFQEKHGHAPAQLIRDRGLLLVGPVGDAGPARSAEAGHRPAPLQPVLAAIQRRLPGIW